MSSFPILSISKLESIAKVLGECCTGSDISRIFIELSINDNSGESTKWKRLYYAFIAIQKQHNSASNISNFIKNILSPERYNEKSDEFEKHRNKLNYILSFSGIEYQKDGNFYKCKVATTIDEAENRVKTIQKMFKERAIHPEIFKYCNTEIMQENYFHAVLEAVKGLSQRIREQSGIEGDGAVLIDKVFLNDPPTLVFNSLRTETEKSEHKGFAALIKGCFAAVRNPLAHVPKILWDGEDDTADYLTLISFLHRKLDKCVKNPMKDLK